MKISRSGYYKWLKNKNILNQYEINRLNMQIKLLEIGKQRDNLKKLYQIQQHFDLRKNVMIGHIIQIYLIMKLLVQMLEIQNMEITH